MQKIDIFTTLFIDEIKIIMSTKKISSVVYQLIFLFSVLVTYGQNAEITQLQKNLPTIKDRTIYVNKLNRIGILLQTKNPDSCFIYGYRAKNIAKGLNYKKGIADANNVMAIGLAVKGMPNKGLQFFKEALSGYTQLKDTANIVQVYMNMSTLFSSLKDERNKINYSKQAMQLGKKIPNDSIMAIVYSNYVISNPSISSDSLKYYRDKSNTIATLNKDYKLLIVNKIDETSKLVFEGKRTEALPLLNSILVESHKLDFEYAELSALHLLSTMNIDNPALALKYSEQAFDIASAHGYSNIIPYILKEILHNAENAGDITKQLETAKKLVAANAVQQQQLQIFFSDYMNFNEIIDKNISLVKQSKTDNRNIIMLIIFSVIALIMIFFTIFLYKKSQKISKRKTTLNRSIRKINHELKEADYFKNRLVSILAHDFRSPLISTLHIVEILSYSPDLSKEQMEEFYTSIKNDISSILDKFDITLQWIRQQLHGYKLNLETLKIAELIEEVADNFVIQMQSKQLIIVNNIPKDALIITDKEMLQFVNRNLINNAIKFSPEGGKIIIDFKQKHSKWIISVSDQGKGLDASSRINLFKVSDLAGSTKEGAGIGLSMCFDFITKLGGEIHEENNADGGATFYYSLPIIQKKQQYNSIS